MSNVAKHAKVVRSDKNSFWYYDRLPKKLRAALAQSEHKWSDMQVYRMWKGNKGYPKLTIAEIIELIRDKDERTRYDWMEDYK